VRRRRSGFIPGRGAGVELGEQLAELLHALLAQSPSPLPLDPRDDLECLADLGPAPLGQEDQARAPIARIGSTLDVTVRFEVVDQVAHRLLGDLGPLGELGEARALRLDVLEDGGVGGADVVEAGLGQALGDSPHDLLEWAPEQDADVGALVARFAMKDLSLRLGLAS
jgi:hypothetical protein